jgi:hypothetical protein
MTSFEAGFIKYAKECGLPDAQVAHILKRAADHPAVQEIFKNLEGDDSPEETEDLNDLWQQEAVDKQMSALNKKIQQ